MTEIQISPDTIQDSSFDGKIILENFYAGANRGEVLCRITEALERDVALMVLSGEEGSGKTMLCRMLESEVSKFCNTVLFPQHVESFEDVVKIVAIRIGLKFDVGYDGKSIDAVLDRITAHLKQESRGLLLIFDEAENLYLATLERIRKMLDRVTNAGARMHIVFAGRKTFLENCDQLSICDFKNTTKSNFDLLPLSEQETGDYLRACSLRLENPDKIKVFNDEVVRNIYSLAKGNFRMTNLLAGESLRAQGDDTGFMVLLEGVKDETGAEEVAGRQDMPHLLKRYAHYLPWIGGVGCIILILFFLIRPGDIRDVVEKAQVHKENAEIVKVTELKATAEEKTAKENVVVLPPDNSVSLPTQVENPLELLSDGSSTAGRSGGSEDEKPGSKGTTVVEGVQQATGGEVQPLLSPVRAMVPPSSAKKVVKLRQEKPLKRKVVGVAPDGGSKAATRVQPPTEVKRAIAANAHLTVDQLLQKRLSAGAAWTKRGKDNAYTMQLMVLTAKNAEGNLKKMLDQSRYREEAGNFFIFKKSPVSEVIFVFYGEYPNITMARLAENNLPSFLRDHQPYAISIKGAMAKVKN